jgi:hypothetical protein
MVRKEETSVVNDKRMSLNLRIDIDKFAVLENWRKQGAGFAQTVSNRSDLYNRALGYGIQTMLLRQQLGDREFDSLWRIIQKVNVRKLNLDKIEEMVTQQ